MSETIKYYVDAQGNYLGAFGLDHPLIPPGSVEVAAPPTNANQTWNGSSWNEWTAPYEAISFVDFLNTEEIDVSDTVNYIMTTAPVQSVNGQTGAIVLNTDAIAEGSTNLYFSEQLVESTPAVVANTAKISAAGSINTHNDVDTDTEPPEVGDTLVWDGSNWVPGASSGTLQDPPVFLNYIDNDLQEIPIPSGTDRILVLMCTCEDNKDWITGASWNGVTGNEIYDKRIENGFEQQAIGFYWLESEIVSVGSEEDINISCTGYITSDEYALYFFENVNQSTPFQDIQTNAGANTSQVVLPAIAPTSQAGLTLYHASLGDNGGVHTFNPTPNRQDNQYVSTLHHTSGYYQLTDANPFVITYTRSGSVNRAVVAAAILNGK